MGRNVGWYFFFQAEDGIRGRLVTGVQTCALPIWRAKYGGMDASMMKRMKELEEENRRLKKMYAEEKLKAEIVKEAMAKKW